MVDASTFNDEQYNIYELDATLKHVVTAGEAGSNTITITGVEAHAVVIADEEYARAYADGVLTTITGVTFPVADTIVAFTGLTEGEVIDLYFPGGGTGCGSLVSNTDTGKLTLPRVQTIQGWNVDANLTRVEECGTVRKQPIEFRKIGTVVLGLYRYGNTALADFTAAFEGDSDDVKIPLLIDVIDSTVATATHDLLFPATVEGFGREVAEEESEKGIITDTVSFKFSPNVVTL